MKGRHEEASSALMREAATGRVTRRSLLKQAFRLGISLPAIAGLLAVTGQQKAVARSGCTGLIVKDYDCIDGCTQSFNSCKARNGKGCQTDFDFYKSGCYSVQCHDEPGEFV